MQELSAQQYVQDHRPRSWSRSTVADGRWMQDKTFTPLNGNDEQLGIYIDELVKGLNTEETNRANADEAEAAARLAYDGVLSGRCDFLYTSATQIRNDLTKESEDRVAGDEATLNAANSYTDTASAYVFGHANDASAHALAEAKTYANDTSAYLNGRINGVSSTFNSFSADLKNWKDGVETWEGEIDTWKTGINTWKNDTVDPKLISLQEQIDTFEQATDVADVVSTSGDLDGYNKTLTKGAIIKVLSAGPNNDQQYYYKNKLTKTSAGPFHIDNFEVLGSVQPYYSKSEIDTEFAKYYKKTQTYSQTEVDNYLQYKVDVSKSQNFTTAQQLQARTNIGASDGTIQWVGPNGTTNAPLKVVSAAGGIHIEDVNAQPTYKYFVAPEATTDNYGMFFGVYGGDKGPVAGWLSPFPAKSSSDAGKSLVVDTDGRPAWKKVPLVIKLGPGSNYMSNDDYAEMVSTIQNDGDVLIYYQYAWYRYISASSGGYVFSTAGNGGVSILTVSIVSTEEGHALTAETHHFLPNVGQTTSAGFSLVLDSNRDATWARRLEGVYEYQNGSTIIRTGLGRIKLRWDATDTDFVKGFIYQDGDDALNMFYARKEADIKLNGKTLKVVDELPSTFAANTIYVV